MSHTGGRSPKIVVKGTSEFTGGKADPEITGLAKYLLHCARGDHSCSLLVLNGRRSMGPVSVPSHIREEPAPPKSDLYPCVCRER